MEYSETGGIQQQQQCGWSMQGTEAGQQGGDRQAENLEGELEAAQECFPLLKEVGYHSLGKGKKINCFYTMIIETQFVFLKKKQNGKAT